MRRVLVTGGLLVMAYAVVGAVFDPDVKLLGVLIFLAGVLVAHDGVLLPAMIGVGALIGRLADPLPIRVAAICTAALTVVGVPLLIGYADVPLIQLLTVLALVWLCALTAWAVRRKRSARSSPASDR